MSPLEAQVLDIGRAGLRNPETIEAEQYGQGGMGLVAALGGQEEGGQLTTVETPGLVGWTWGRRTYWAGLEAITPSTWAKR